jgi:predicted SAM-dependent methyltransferase
MSTTPKRFLNLGCGQRFHPDWVNLDFRSADPSVMAHDLRRGIPFPSSSFDVVYHSHVLEHFPRDKGQLFLRECYRVLKPGGIIRVAVPDLEQIARLYLKALDLAREGDLDWQHHYDWMMIEMYDQTIRETSGGGHAAFLSRDVIPNLEFVLARQGKEIERALAEVRGSRVRHAASAPIAQALERAPGERKQSGMYRAVRTVWHGVRDLMTSPAALRERIGLRLLGQDSALLQLGRFRTSGEVHQWMYDSYSLAKALTAAGFLEPRRCGAAESGVAGWATFCLDTEPNGSVYKPDSLYMEAVKGGS